jgi:hypothetical protein
MKDSFRSYQPFKKELVIGTELYDYKNDPLETVNVAADKKYTTVSNDLYKSMLAFFKSQVK